MSIAWLILLLSAGLRDNPAHCLAVMIAAMNSAQHVGDGDLLGLLLAVAAR
jgi:hypothetical protein